MKKKLFVGISAAALAAVMCVAFVGCGDSGAPAKGVKGEEVTKEQWDAAIDLLTDDDAIFTIDYLEEMEEEMKAGSMSSSSARTCTISAIKNGAKEYVKMTDHVEASGLAATEGNGTKDEVDEMYAERSGNWYTIYEKTDSGWDKTENGDSIIPISVIFDVVSSYSYDKYTYSSEYKGYILTSDTSENPYVLKFDKAGKLVALYRGYEESGSEGGASVSAAYSLSVMITYEAKEITIPTVA